MSILPKIEFYFAGLDELKANLDKFVPALQKRIVVASVRKSGKVLVNKLKTSIRKSVTKKWSTGALSRSIGFKLIDYTKSGKIIALIGAKRGYSEVHSQNLFAKIQITRFLKGNKRGFTKSINRGTALRKKDTQLIKKGKTVKRVPTRYLHLFENPHKIVIRKQIVGTFPGRKVMRNLIDSEYNNFKNDLFSNMIRFMNTSLKKQVLKQGKLIK